MDDRRRETEIEVWSYNDEYRGTWADFVSMVEAKISGLSEADRPSVEVISEWDYDTGGSFYIKGKHVETD